MALTATAAYFLASGLISLGLASLLFAWNFPDRLNRALGVAFVFQGLARTLPFLPDAPGPLHALRMVAFYLDVAYPFAILYVAAAYRDRYGRPGLRRIALPSLLVGGFVAEWLYLVDHDAFRLNRSLGFGLYWLSIFGPALMAAILASDAARSRSEARRRSLSLASLGFAFFPTAYVLHMWIPGLMAVVRGISTFKAAVLLLCLVPLAYVIVRFILFSIPAVETKARRHARAYLAVLAIAPLTVLGLAVVRYSAPFAMTQRTMAAIMITWTILGNLVVAYAILWHQAFGVERKLKVTLQRGTIVAAFVLVFLVAAQFLQAFVDTYSWFWSGLVAALVLFAVRPLSRLGLRLAEAAMPDVDDTPVYRAYRRIQVYESALMAAWEDGKLKSEERSRLEHLRRRLELPTADAKAIERDFVATMASRNVPFAT